MGSVPERMSQKRIFLSYKEERRLLLVNVIGIRLFLCKKKSWLSFPYLRKIRDH